VRSTRAAIEYFEGHARGLRSGRASAAMENLTTAQIAAARSIAASARHIRPPMQRIEQHLQPWVNFMILPLFALANAGVVLSAEAVGALTSPTTLGVVLGLFVGKPLGITVACLLGVKLGLAALPRGVTWVHVIGVSMLGGIGFTMAIFITNLSFVPGMPAAADAATLAILAASGLSAMIGLTILMTRPIARERLREAAAIPAPNPDLLIDDDDQDERGG